MRQTRIAGSVMERNNVSDLNDTAGPAIPGGPMASRPVHFFWILDCSLSMTMDGKIGELNSAIREALPAMRDDGAPTRTVPTGRTAALRPGLLIEFGGAAEAVYRER